MQSHGALFKRHERACARKCSTTARVKAGLGCRKPMRCLAQQQQQQTGLPPLPTQQQQQQPAQTNLARWANKSAPLAREPPNSVWIPISGPPTDDPPELRRMQHPADAADVAPTSLVEVATPQQLAIGKREAREQAVALATASAEIIKWKGVADELLAAKQLLTVRARELEEQRNQSMAINQELLEGYKQMQRELQVANQKLQQYERSYMGMRQDLLNLKASVESLDDADALLGSSAVAVTAQAQQAASTSGKGSGRGFADGIPGGDLLSAAMQQLLQISKQMARDAERADKKREMIKSELTSAAPASKNSNNGNGAGNNGTGSAASSGTPRAFFSGNGNGNGAGSKSSGAAAKGTVAFAAGTNGKGSAAVGAKEAA